MVVLSSRNTLFLLSAILVLALGLRLYRVGTYGIYFDEKSTLLISQGVVLEGFNQKDVFSKKYFTPAEFWKPKTINDFVQANARGDIGSPVYFGVVWAWMEVFGLSDASLRMPSVLFSTLMVLLLYIFVSVHFQSATLALVSSSIAAVEPFFVAYSHIARTYSLTFFMTLLATHIFLLIMRGANQAFTAKPRTNGWLYGAYSLLFAGCILCHYLTVIVFVCHALYALLFLRRLRSWVLLGLAAIAGLLVVLPWFIYGSGKYHFATMAYQAELYRNIALTNPTGSSYGLVLPATLANITKRAIPIFSDLFIVTNGLGSALIGLRNSAVALGLGLAATVVMHRNLTVQNPPIWVYGAVPLLLLVGLPIYTVVPFRFLVLSVAIPFIYLIGRYVLDKIDADRKRLVVLLVLLALVPTLFLLFMAWRSGHTFGVTQRYSGFSFPYMCILVAMGLLQLVSLRWWFSLPIGLVLLVQGAHIVQLLSDIYADKAPKYTYFDKTRIANPYWSSAQQLMRQYAPGDTILYPNKDRFIQSEKMDRTYSPVSLLDAQLVNVYLPEDAQYIQRIDPNERNRIVLVKGQSGKKFTIFDFQGKTYRYGE